MSAAPRPSPASDHPPSAGPEDVLSTYDAVADDYARQRDRSLFERRWLDRLLAAAPRASGRRRVLDLGCGTGRPLAGYLADRGAEVTGVDGSRAMLRHFQKALRKARAFHLDMRGLALGEDFDAILAWNSFFHLAAADQREMFTTFRLHAAPNAALMFTTGHSAGIAIGEVGGAPIYHESLSPEDYATLLTDAGFRVLDFRPEDPDTNGHSVWLARRDPSLD